MDGILGKIGIFLICLLLIPAIFGLGGGILIGNATHSITLITLWFIFCAIVCGIIAKNMDDDYGAVKWSILLCFVVFVLFDIELIFNAKIFTGGRDGVLGLLSAIEQANKGLTDAQIIKLWQF